MDKVLFLQTESHTPLLQEQLTSEQWRAILRLSSLGRMRCESMRHCVKEIVKRGILVVITTPSQKNSLPWRPRFKHNEPLEKWAILMIIYLSITFFLSLYFIVRPSHRNRESDPFHSVEISATSQYNATAGTLGSELHFRLGFFFNVNPEQFSLNLNSFWKISTWLELCLKYFPFIISIFQQNSQLITENVLFKN